ncbi:MAG: hypothetical protein JNK49_17030 [Planctomycetes bacterium]|nr:hypothetical protein [Planctomycetota bacterium]
MLKAVSAWVGWPLLLLAASFELVTFVPEARVAARVTQIAIAVAGASLIAAAMPRLRLVGLLTFVVSGAVLAALALGLGW